MSAIELLAKLFTDTYMGDAWHGPSLTAVIEDVGAEEASKKPSSNVHSIAELTHHAAYWMKAVRHWITGEQLTPNQDESWGKQDLDLEAYWADAKKSLAEEYRALKQAIDNFPEAKLAEAANESGLTYYGLIHGAIHHNLYHAGQMALLKKME